MTPKERRKLKKTWKDMVYRCRPVNANRFPRYAGRGILVCQQWIDSFEQFALDVGIAPSDAHSLDRRDNDGNYEPSNCRWATKAEQTRNTSRTYAAHTSSITEDMLP